MEIGGKIHCFFEQSGTFKKEFIKLGYKAEDYDIQNNFGETDHVVDLFSEIEKGYESQPSVFDRIRGGKMETSSWLSFHASISVQCPNSFSLSVKTK